MPGDSFYITTPIYYVNGTPHIGHAYTTVAADTAARWQRCKGREVLFLTGTDEHGQKVLEAAEARGLTPRAHVDDMVPAWRAMMDKLQVTHDRFIRTTDADHEALVRAILTKLHDAGDIYFDTYEGWYLVTDEVFVTELERTEQLESGAQSEDAYRWVSEGNYFFKMGKYQQALLDHIAAHPDFIQPEARRNEVLGFLRRELTDLCISRPKERMSWGVALPFDDKYVCYVWFDALINYLTGTGFQLDGDASYQKWWPVDYHLVGKDILTTHSVYWTTMLLALGVDLPQHIYAHGWWVSSDGDKMSKSRGNVIDVDLLVQEFGLDATRYFFLREARFGADSGFSFEGYMGRYNADLANDLGNLAHRALSMTTKWLGGVVPQRAAPDAALHATAVAAVETFASQMDRLQFQQALVALWDVVKAGNKHIDTTQPWALNKAGETAALAAVMRDVLEVCALVGTLMAPVLPSKGPELVAKLGASPPTEWLTELLAGRRVLDGLTAGSALQTGDPLFPRHRELPPKIAALFAVEEPEEVPLPEIDWIAYDDFAKVELKVGTVLSADIHPNADKLLVLQVELGEARPRTICAGIKSVFEPAALVGRSVVVVANLAPRTLRGVASEGMILAAGGADVVDLVSAAAPPGAPVR